MQQRDMNNEDMYDEPIVPGGGRKGDYAGYYEEDEMGGDMRPQSFEQSRPLHQSPPPPAHHNNPSPYGSPYGQHQEKHDSYGASQPQQQPQQYDPYPDQPYSAAHPSPFDDYYAHHSPEPPVAQQPYTVPSPPQQHGGSFTPVPMPMPDHTHYGNSASPEMNNSRY